MMKKFALALAGLFCAVGAAVAQTVASECTKYSELTDGAKYAILVKSDKTLSTGNMLYCDGTNFYVDNQSKANKLGQKLGSDEQKYIFQVEKNSSGICLKSLSSGKYLQTGDEDDDKLSLGTSSNTFSVTESDSGVKLYYSYKKRTSILSTTTYTCYVVNNNSSSSSTTDSYIGAYGKSNKGANDTNVAVLEFYALSDVQTVSFNYNYIYNGTSKGTEAVTAIVGNSYPEPTTLNAFVKAQLPTGEVTESLDGTNVDITVTDNLPFQISTNAAPVYYYLTVSGKRVYGNSGNNAVLYRDDAQAEALNDVQNDLWYVTGDAYDNTIQLHSVGSAHTAKSYLALSTLTQLAFNSGVGGGNEDWQMVSLGNNKYAFYKFNNWVTGNGNCAWYYDGRAIGFRTFTASSDLTEAYQFELVEPTFQINLNTSAADNNQTFATTCLPFASEVVSTDAKACAGTLNAEGTELTLNAVSAIPANQGVVLNGEEGVSSITLKAIYTADAIQNDLLGTTTALTDMTNILGFGRANGDGQVGFFRSTNSSMKANRAYLTSATANAIGMNFGGNVTAINNIDFNTANTQSAIYDLSGRRVSNPTRGGIYIKNGKKYIAR